MDQIDRLTELDPLKIALGLERMVQLMERLGNPEKGFRSVHIAGTNGKGSTAAFLSSVLTQAGFKTGLYTSPHLERFSERIRINGEEIDEDDVDQLSCIVKEAAKDLPAGEPTYFEFTTALAFLFFERKKVEIAIIETGLGGRLDATNVIEPVLSIITPVALDHADYLGETIRDVAVEKSGILKEGTPLVTGAQRSEVSVVLEDAAKECSAKVYRLGRDFGVKNIKSDSFSYWGIKLNLNDIILSMKGSYQYENCATAIAALEILKDLGFESDDALRRGVEKATWPGRFEIISKDPHIILDGAHNPSAAGRLSDTVRACCGDNKGVVVAGFMEDKDVEGILREIAPLARMLILTRPDQERAFDPEGKISYKERLIGECEFMVIPNIREAIKQGISFLNGNRFMLITGSLYTVGEARTILKGVE